MENKKNEDNLNNAENYLFELSELADELKGKYEFSTEIANVDKLKKLARDAKKEVEKAKNQNG